MTATTNPPPSPEGPTRSMIYTLVLNLILFVIFVMIFEFSRKYKQIFLKRYQHKFIKANRVPPPPDEGVFGWIWAVLTVEEVDVMHMVGLDAYMLLRYHVVCLKLCVFLSIWGLLVLLPTYSTVDNLMYWDKYTALNVINSSHPHRVWVTAVFGYIFAAYFCQLLYSEYQHFVNLRLNALLANHDQVTSAYADNPTQKYYTVMVESIPAELRSAENLYRYFDELFPGEVFKVEIALNLRDLNAVTKRRQQARANLERAIASFIATGQRPNTYVQKKPFAFLPNGLSSALMHFPCTIAAWKERLHELTTIERYGFELVDAIDHYTAELIHLNQKTLDMQMEAFEFSKAINSKDMVWRMKNRYDTRAAAAVEKLGQRSNRIVETVSKQGIETVLFGTAGGGGSGNNKKKRVVKSETHVTTLNPIIEETMHDIENQNDNSDNGTNHNNSKNSSNTTNHNDMNINSHDDITSGTVHGTMTSELTSSQPSHDETFNGLDDSVIDIRTGVPTASINTADDDVSVHSAHSSHSHNSYNSLNSMNSLKAPNGTNSNSGGASVGTDRAVNRSKLRDHAKVLECWQAAEESLGTQSAVSNSNTGITGITGISGNSGISSGGDGDVMRSPGSSASNVINVNGNSINSSNNNTPIANNTNINNISSNSILTPISSASEDRDELQISSTPHYSDGQGFPGITIDLNATRLVVGDEVVNPMQGSLAMSNEASVTSPMSMASQFDGSPDRDMSDMNSQSDNFNVNGMQQRVDSGVSWKERLFSIIPDALKTNRRTNAVVEKAKFVGKHGWNQTKLAGVGALRGVIEMERFLEMLTVGAYYQYSSTAFVTFSSRTAETLAHQLLLSHETQMQISHAPNPQEIIWDNIATPKSQIIMRTYITNIGLIIGSIFWSSLVTSINEFAASLSLPESQQYFLSVLIILLFLLMLPFIFDTIARYYEGMKLESEVQNSINTRYFYYQLVNIFVTVCLGGVNMNHLLEDVFRSPHMIVAILGSTIPSLSLYFCTLVIVKIFVAIPIEMLRPWQLSTILLLGTCMDKRKTTRRDLRTGAFYAWPNLYGWIYPQLLLVQMIMVTYSCFAPLLMPFGALFFIVSYFMYKYQLLFVYVNSDQSLGFMWYAVFNRSLIALFFASLVLLGFFGMHSEKITSAPMMFTVPLPLAILYFWHYCDQRFKKSSVDLSFSSAKKIDHRINSRKQSGKWVPQDSFTKHMYRQPTLTEPPQYPEPYRIPGDAESDILSGVERPSTTNRTRRRSSSSWISMVPLGTRGDDSTNANVESADTTQTHYRLRSQSINIYAVEDEVEDPPETLEQYFENVVLRQLCTDKELHMANSPSQ